MIRLGIDISCLANPLTGIGRYTLNLVKELSKKDNIQLFLYSHSNINDKIYKHLESFKITICDQSENKFLKYIKSHIYLPYLLKKDKVNLFWGPSHKIPFFMPITIPSIVTIHDLVYKVHPETMHTKTKFLENIHIPYSIKKSTHILTVSNVIKESIITKFDIHEEKISVIHNGINPIDRYPLKKDTFPNKYILFVGTLEPRKNLHRLLKAYSKLNEQIRLDYPLLIVGGKGWGDVHLTKIIHELNIKNTVQLMGYVDDDSLESLYAHCSFLAYPSLYEGFGLPIIEAAKYGKMVLTSNTSSMPEVAGNYGVFVDPLSVDSIYDGFVKLIHEHSEKKPLQKFTWEKSAEDLVTVFERVLIKFQDTKSL